MEPETEAPFPYSLMLVMFGLGFLLVEYLAFSTGKPTGPAAAVVWINVALIYGIWKRTLWGFVLTILTSVVSIGYVCYAVFASSVPVTRDMFFVRAGVQAAILGLLITCRLRGSYFPKKQGGSRPGSTTIF